MNSNESRAMPFSLKFISLYCVLFYLSSVQIVRFVHCFRIRRGWCETRRLTGCSRWVRGSSVSRWVGISWWRPTRTRRPGGAAARLTSATSSVTTCVTADWKTSRLGVRS